MRIAACRLVDRLDDPGLDPRLVQILVDSKSDPYLRRCALAAIADPDLRRLELLAWLDRDGPAALTEDAELFEADLPGDFVRTWRVVGYFDPSAAGETPPAPEASGDLDRRFEGRSGDLGWEERQTHRDGYLDLLGLDTDPVLAEHALAYAEVWLRSPIAGEVPFTLGTDDGCVFFVNGEPVVVDTGSHGATPLQHFGKFAVRVGWNRALLRVENGRGGFGAYLRVLDDKVFTAPRPGPSSESGLGQ